MLARGLDTHAMARALFVSPITVRTHVQNLLRKLGVHTRAEAVARVRRLGELSNVTSEGASAAAMGRSSSMSGSASSIGRSWVKRRLRASSTHRPDRRETLRARILSSLHS
ncbi:MAG: LuxR C-terminal-related transcriptional regulator [Firmicutes bacterium]|nr:LuxR C-terminal-related transcriptional regulator [Bacillota bacterium]